MLKAKRHALTVILGIFVVAAVLCTHVFQGIGIQPKSKAKTEQNSERLPNHAALTAATSVAPPASTHVEVNLLAHFIFELKNSAFDEALNECVALTKPEKLFRTLFRVIISPNAP